MGNQASSELDATIGKLIELKSKPALLKAELNKFVQQVPLDHSYDMRVDKKLFDILMDLVSLELKQPGAPDLHIIMMTVQRLLRVKGFYAAIPRCSLVPLLQCLQQKDPAIVMSALNTISWVLSCHITVDPKDKKFDVALQETAAKQAFFESKGYEMLINRVLLWSTRNRAHPNIAAKVIDMLALDLVDNCVTTRFVGIQKLLALLTPHIDLLLALTRDADLNTRCYASILLQGYLLHSSLSTTQNLQSKVLEEGHVLWYILFAVDAANLPSSHPYKRDFYDKNLTELSRNLLGLLCAGNPAIVEMSVQKTIPKPLQVSLESLNADSKTNTALSARSRAEKETIKNTLWNNFQSGRMMRVNLHPQFQRLDQVVKEPHILWTVSTKAELCQGLLQEIDDLRLQKESRVDARWDYDGWEIVYRSLDRYLRVGGYYISLLLPALQDRSSSYVIELDRIHGLLAALFQRSVTTDEPGWKLACLRTMTALYEKYGDQLTKDLEVVPYFAWLIDPKHTLPVYRDHILRLLTILLKDAGNVKRFVKSDGVHHLLYYISRVLTLPDVAPPAPKKTKPTKKKSQRNSEEDPSLSAAEEEEEGEKKELTAEELVKASRSVASVAEDDDEDETGVKIATEKQNLLVGLPAPLTITETATICLALLRLVQKGGPKMRRVMSEKDVVNTLVRVLMAPVPSVKEEATQLLLDILDHSAHLSTKLCTTGAFSFLVYGLRHGPSPAVLELIAKYHLKQEKKYVEPGESALAPFFPRALVEVLKTQGVAAFGELFESREGGAGGAAGGAGTDLLWNPGLKKHLVEVMTRRLAAFRILLDKDPFAEYRFSPPEPIRYPSLESDLCMSGVFLRQLNETGGVPALLAQVQIDQPEELMEELVRSLNARRFAGIDLLTILTAQVILIKSMPQLVGVQSYAGWEAIFEILKSHDQEQEYPMIEKAAEIIHALLALKPARSPHHADHQQEEDENLEAFVDAHGIPLLAKTLDHFASLPVHHILTQRILIALLHVVYDVAWKRSNLVSRDFASNKKYMRKCVLAFLGRRATTTHAMLSVVTCKALMSLSLSDKFQTMLLETGALLHLVDMAVFYRPANANGADPSNANSPASRGMDEEKRVRLAASSVLSVLAGYTTPAIQPEPNPQVQRVLSALLTSDLAKSLQNPSGFVARCTELRGPGGNNGALASLAKYLEGELFVVQKSAEWAQKQWPFSPVFVIRPQRAQAPRRAAPQPVDYDENGEPIESYDDEDAAQGDAEEEVGEDQDLPDAYAAAQPAPVRRPASSGSKLQSKMESLSAGIEDKMASAGASIGGAFNSFRNKAKSMVSPAKGKAPAAAPKEPTPNARPAAAAAKAQPNPAAAAAKKPAAAQPNQQQQQQRVPAGAAPRGAVQTKAAVAAVGVAVATGVAVKKAAAPVKKQAPPPPPVQPQYDEEEYQDEEEVEAVDSSSFYDAPEPEFNNLKSPSTQHTPYGDASSSVEPQYEEPVAEGEEQEEQEVEQQESEQDQAYHQEHDQQQYGENGHYDAYGNDEYADANGEQGSYDAAEEYVDPDQDSYDENGNTDYQHQGEDEENFVGQ